MSKTILAFVFIAAFAHGQAYPPGGSGATSVSSVPATCTPTGSQTTVFLTSGQIGLYACTATDTWTFLGGTGSGSILNGSGAPGSGTGTDASFYLDTDVSCLYGPKASGAWPSTCVSLVGQPGAAGPQGSSGAPGVPGYSPNAVISGGGVGWVSGYTFRVTAASYTIAGQKYASAQTNVTLGAADPTNDRIDVVVANASSAIVVVAGSPSATPAPPSIDASTQLQLSFVYVTASSSQPAAVSTVTLYKENVGASTEWNCTNSGSPITCNSTSNPFAGSKDIEGTSGATGNYAQLAKGSGTVDLSLYSNLVLHIRSKAAWGSKRSLQIYFASTGTKIGQAVTLNETMFGFNSATTSSYQQIVIPLSLFVPTAVVNQLLFKVAGTGTNIGFYLDDITLQGGVSQGSGYPGLVWCGSWNSTATYAANCAVLYNAALWVSLASNTNSTPAASNTNWAQSSLQIAVGSSTPGTCTLGKDMYFNTASVALYVCTATNTYTVAVPAASGAFLSGATDPGVPAVPTVVQSKHRGGQAGTFGGGTLTTTGNVTSGNMLFAFLYCWPGSSGIGTHTIADTRSSTWTSVIDQATLTVWKTVLGSSGSEVITFSGGTCTTDSATAVIEVSNSNNTVDVSQYATGVSAAPAVTTTVGQDLVVGFIARGYASPGFAVTSPTVQDQIQQDPGGGGVGLALGHLAATGAGSYTPSVTGPSNADASYEVAATIGIAAIPVSVPGSNGDFYLNTTTGVLWGPKSGGVWSSSGGSLTISSNTVLTGTTSSISGAVTLGVCDSGTATVTGAAVGMDAHATPSTYPGDGTVWNAYVSSSNTVTVKLCGLSAVTPSASVFNVRVIQ